MDDANKVTLVVNGSEYSWWKSVSVVAELTNITRQFNVSFTQDLSGDVQRPFEQIPKAGDAVTLKIGGDVFCTGYITGSNSRYSANQVSLSVSGSSKTVDLIECTLPIDSPHKYANIPLREVVASLTKTYGIGVVDEAGAVQKVSYDVTPTKKLKSCIEELVKEHSVILTDDESGNLVITVPGKRGMAKDALRLGENILRGDRSVKSGGVYSKITVVGQSANAGSNLSVTANQSRASAEVTGVRHRELVIQQTGDVRLGAMQKRAALLRNYAVGSAETYLYTVQGWRQSTGELWKPNMLVRIVDPYFALDANLLIDQVTYSKGENGTTAELRCISPDALLDTDEKKPKPQKKVSNASPAAAGNYSAKGDTKDGTWSE